MAKFTFRLNGMLSIKEKIEERKKLDYAEAINELEHEKAQKLKLVEEKENTIISFKKSIETDIKPAELRRLNDYVELIKKRIIEREKKIKEAVIKVEKKRLELVEAVKERKMLEALKEKEYEKYIIEEKIAEQKQVDEVVSYQYNKRGG